MKKISRSDSNKAIAGVCGGIGEYFDVDPVIVRLLFVLITLMTGLVPGIIFYVLGSVLIPTKKNS